MLRFLLRYASKFTGGADAWGVLDGGLKGVNGSATSVVGVTVATRGAVLA